MSKYRDPQSETQQAPPDALDLAAGAWRRLLEGKGQNGTAAESCLDYAEAVRMGYEAYADGGAELARKVFDDIVAPAYPDLARAVAGDVLDQRFRVGSFAEALLDRPPLTWRVKGLISDGSVNVFFGDGGTKKTWLLLDLLFAVALGGRWLGRDTVQGGALVIDEESGNRRLLDRLQALGRARRAGAKTPLYWTSLDGLDLFADDEDAEALQAEIERLGVSIVLIDSLSMVAAGAEENGTEDMAPVLRRLRRVAEATNAAIVVIHHANRGGTYRGSTAIKQSCDLMIKVESKEGSPNIDFTTEKARDVEAFRMAAHIRFENGDDGRAEAVFVSPADPTEEAPSWSLSEKHVLEFLQENGASSTSAIKDAAEICSPDSARRAIYKLVDKGEVRRVDDGGAGQEAMYDLTQNVLR